MLKGHTTIELKNVETGEIERYEDDNLITHAIDYIIDMELANNCAPNDYCLPVATKLLGGLMMFDGALEESADNIHFPTTCWASNPYGRKAACASSIWRSSP